MALNTAALKSDLQALYATSRSGSGVTDSYFADSMANIFTAFVQTGTVNTTVTGVQPGGGTAPGTGTIT